MYSLILNEKNSKKKFPTKFGNKYFYTKKIQFYEFSVVFREQF